MFPVVAAEDVAIKTELPPLEPEEAHDAAPAPPAPTVIQS
jgi:hypothetical protein